MKKILSVEVDFKQNVNLLPSLHTANQWQYIYGLGKNSTFSLKSTLKHIFSMKFCTLVYKYIFSHIVKRNYAYAPKIYFYRLISSKKTLDFEKSN